jgi:site-specific DNA recombinase
MARVIVAMANKQSADTSRRVKRKHKAMQKNGIPAGGPRPFGWKEDRRTIHEHEAGIIRDATQRLIRGATWYEIVADLNDRGIRTAQGNKWSRRTLQVMMCNPRICGYRSRVETEINPETGKQSARRMVVVYGDDGEPVIGQHQPIISTHEWQTITAMAEESPKRGSGHNTRKYLAAGTLRCGKEGCGTKLRAMKAAPARRKPEGYFYYTCPSKGTGKGCGGVSVGGPETDELIRKLLFSHYEEQAKRRNAVTPLESWPNEVELANVCEDIEDLKKARKDRLISAQRYYKDLAEYENEEQRLTRDRNTWNRKTLAAQGKPVNISEEWERPGITLTEKRAYLEQVFTAIIVLPVGKGVRLPLRQRMVPLPSEE